MRIMKRFDHVLNAMQDELELPNLPSRLVDLGLDAYKAGYRVAAEHLFYLAEQMLDHPRELQ